MWGIYARGTHSPGTTRADVGRSGQANELKCASPPSGALAVVTMRIHSLLLSLAVMIAVGAAFAAGQYIGRHDAEKASRSTIDLIQVDNDAEVFRLANSARLALQVSKPEQASQMLTTWVALKAQALSECSAKAECVGWLGPQMPSKALLEEVIAADRAQRN